MTTKHTETPWVGIDGGRRIGVVVSDPKFSTKVYAAIADVHQRGTPAEAAFVQKANAEFIVRACNAHDELVDYILFMTMIPANNSSQQIKLEAAARDRGWKGDQPVEHWADEFRHRVLRKARGEA